jgi:long-subunit fatty acid transport protein
MKKTIIALIILTMGILPLFGAVFAKSGTAALQFLKLGIDARAIGMGEAYTAVSDDISSVYWNPAGLALRDERQLFFSHTNWVAETYHEFMAGSMVTDYGYIALFASVFHTPPMDETTEDVFGPTGRQFKFSNLALGLTYANLFTDKFSFGITGKYLREDIADLSVNSFAVDLGTMYNTGWRNTTIGMSLRNFGGDVQYDVPQDESEIQDGNQMLVVDKSGSPAKLPMNFSLGISTDIFRDDLNYLIASAQLDNCVDREETWNVGVEYKMSNLFLRCGYQIGYDAASYSFGFGVRVPTRMAIFNIDYAYTDMGRLQEDFFSAAHRVSVKMFF